MIAKVFADVALDASRSLKTVGAGPRRVEGGGVGETGGRVEGEGGQEVEVTEELAKTTGARAKEFVTVGVVDHDCACRNAEYLQTSQ